MKYALLATFDNYIPAHIALGRLEEEGINCWLQDENTATITPIFTNAIGGIKLMVADPHFSRASELLQQFSNEQKQALLQLNLMKKQTRKTANVLDFVGVINALSVIVMA